MRTVRSLVILSVVALGGVACRSETPRQSTADTTAAKAAAGPTGPQRYTVVVDGPSTLGAENLVYGAYFPKTLSVRPGDTVVFDNRSSNDIHTITLGVKSDRSDQPLTVLKSGQANPVVFGPCFTSEAARPDLAACPGQQPGAAAAAPAPPPPFTGKGYWNSGAILFASAPPAAGSKTATVELAADIAPGAYTVTCLLHPFMESSLQVVAPDGARLSLAEVAATADKELGVAKADATGVAVPAQVPVGNGATVAAGWGDKLVAVNRYSPETVSIKVGQTVTWRTVSPYMPHTVSFQPPFQSPDQPNALLPTGVKSGARFGGGVSHSGIFGPPPEFPNDTFSLTFTKPGTYSYLCVLHPGMAGTVQVS